MSTISVVEDKINVKATTFYEDLLKVKQQVSKTESRHQKSINLITNNVKQSRMCFQTNDPPPPLSKIATKL